MIPVNLHFKRTRSAKNRLSKMFTPEEIWAIKVSKKIMKIGCNLKTERGTNNKFFTGCLLIQMRVFNYFSKILTPRKGLK
jgi:hypothetical protein